MGPDEVGGLRRDFGACSLKLDDEGCCWNSILPLPLLLLLPGVMDACEAGTSG